MPPRTPQPQGALARHRHAANGGAGRREACLRGPDLLPGGFAIKGGARA